MPPKKGRMGRKRKNSQAINDEEDLGSVEHTHGEVMPRRTRNNDADEPPEARARVETVTQPKWSLNSRVREVLLHGMNLPETLKLNDFLRNNVGGRGVVDANENVTMEAFAKKPAMYIQDEELRNHITALPAYEEIKENIKVRNTLRGVANNLEKAGVYYLRQWDKFTDKESILLMARGILDGALDVAKENMLVSGCAVPVVMEGVYESVYNATWHYVEGVVGEGFGMQVKEGHPLKPWTYDESMFCPVIFLMEKPEDGRLELMVLTSKKGWPCAGFGMNKSCDIYVNKEVMRTWRIIERSLDEYFVNNVNANKELIPYVLIGTPGIGKSFAAGSFLLYQLLHYDAERLPVVAYFIQGAAYLFEKNTDGGKVTLYEDHNTARDVIQELSQERKGYIIYDVGANGAAPPVSLPPSGWGMIVITPPNEDKYEEWKVQKGAEWIVINCPFMINIKAICAWKKRDQSDELEDYWDEIRERVNDIGPLPRYIFDDDAYEKRQKEVDSALSEISKSNVSEYINIIQHNAKWNDQSPSHKLVQIYREADYDDGHDIPKNKAITIELLSDVVRNVNRSYQPPLPAQLFAPRGAPNLSLLEEMGVFAFLNGNFVAELRKHVEIIQPPGDREGRKGLLQGRRSAPFPTGFSHFPLSKEERQKEWDFDKLYYTFESDFPPVDAFYFVFPPRGRVKLIGIKRATAKTHETTADKVCKFKKNLESSFSDWASVGHLVEWEIVYIYPYGESESEGGQVREWHKCTLKKSKEYTDEEQKDIIKFWDEKVNQYHVN